ncbi:MAG: serine/threonine protein kinase [Candidatus Krumholzibacteriia bacterium]
MIGKTLAHYEVISKLGEGGMGEVFRARDTHLSREVALKILPQEVSDNPERAARFEREAVTLASLQHPNVASIYGYEQAEGVRFLVMELVEGEDLAERLKRGAIPIEEVAQIASQIALGLEAAHEGNIVHRDLKPANVRIDTDGVVKILDFGLARAYSDDKSDQYNVQASPTITAAMTQMGVVLGTAAYMSPEQARGKPVDKRSDIWAFGVIIYEMLMGMPLYRGETVTDILGAIVHSDPDLSALPKKTPTGLRTLMRRCLTPDAQDRLRDIGEARYALANLDQAEPQFASAERTGASTKVWSIASVVLFLALAAVTTLWFQSEPETQVLRASIALPEGAVLRTLGTSGGSMRFSPDGQSIAFVAQFGGVQQIWVRKLSEHQGHPVQGTEYGHRPFWSPDGKSLGFFTPGSMRRVAASGGAPLTIAAASDGRGACWLEDGTIIFAPNPGAILLRVDGGGGEATPIVNGGEPGQREPRSIGDGEHFLFQETRGGLGWMVCLGNIDGSDRRELVMTTAGADYTKGQLLYLKGKTLVTQSLDINSGQVTGDPVPIAEGIVRDRDYGMGAFTVSPQSALAYQADERTGSELVLFDREGNKLRSVGEPGVFSQVAWSPDNTRIALLIDEGSQVSDFWMINVSNGSRQRFTFTPTDESSGPTQPLWSPDGERLFFNVEEVSESSVYAKQTDGGGNEDLILNIPGAKIWPYDISDDGQWLLFGLEREDSNEDLWVFPLNGGGEARPVFETPFDEWPGNFSPDGRWLAFDSDESGRREIYVIPFPEGGGKWQVSRAGGRYPQWNDDGTELFFQSQEGGIMAVLVDSEGTNFSAGDPQELLKSTFANGAMGDFTPSRDGDSLLVVERSVQEAPISLYLNWVEDLAER